MQPESLETTDAQFAGVEDRALAILDREAWGDMEEAIRNVEIGLALLIEATRTWLADWDEEVSPAFDEENGIETDEFTLTREQVHDLSDPWRLAYIARLVETVCLSYGLSTGVGAKGPGRSSEGDISPPTEWANDQAAFPDGPQEIARLLQGLDRLLTEKNLYDRLSGPEGDEEVARDGA